MAAKLPPVPMQAEMTNDKGMPAPVWADFFKQLFARAGGSLGKTDDFASNLVASGYQTLPGGLILQWGSAGSIASGATGAVTFPKAFASACFQVFVSLGDNSAVATTATGNPGVGAITKTGCTIYNRTSVAQSINWWAVGA